eukprot:6174312-Pleurochrysis_carterae.AAC.1
MKAQNISISWIRAENRRSHMFAVIHCVALQAWKGVRRGSISMHDEDARDIFPTRIHLAALLLTQKTDQWLVSGPRRLRLERVPLSERAGNGAPRPKGASAR